jgi:hypothetical protein
MSEHDLPPPVKPKLSKNKRRTRLTDRSRAICLRVLIGRELENRRGTDPSEIGAVVGMTALGATKLLTRHQWREGDVTRLQAAAARLGVDVPSGDT